MIVLGMLADVSNGRSSPADFAAGFFSGEGLLDDFADAAGFAEAAGFVPGAAFIEEPQKGHSVASSSRTDWPQAGQTAKSIMLHRGGIRDRERRRGSSA